MGKRIVIYDNGKTYEIDSDEIYEPFPNGDKNEKQVSDKKADNNLE
jgi:hypothetical protein